MNKFVVQNGILNFYAAPPWEMVGAADFTGDRKPDLFWRNRETGQNAVWEMDNGVFKKGTLLPNVVGGGWDVRGVADFNGDGKADLVWRNATSGENAIWLMNGNTINDSFLLPGVADLNWHLEVVADLSNDGHPDLIWRNYATGKNAMWYLDQRGKFAGSAYLLDVPVGLGWKLGGRSENVAGVPNPFHQNFLSGSSCGRRETLIPSPASLANPRPAGCAGENQRLRRKFNWQRRGLGKPPLQRGRRMATLSQVLEGLPDNFLREHCNRLFGTELHGNYGAAVPQEIIKAHEDMPGRRGGSFAHPKIADPCPGPTYPSLTRRAGEGVTAESAAFLGVNK